MTHEEMIKVLEQLYNIRIGQCGFMPPYETSGEAKALTQVIEILKRMDICGVCDCGGMIEMGGHKYIRMDFLFSYGYEKIPIRQRKATLPHEIN